MEFDCTYHFIKRVRKRVGLNKKGAEQWAAKFIAEGKRANEFGGKFHAYLSSVENDRRHPATTTITRAPYIILMREGDHVPRLITLYHVPPEHRRAAFKKKSKDQQKKELP